MLSRFRLVSWLFLSHNVVKFGLLLTSNTVSWLLAQFSSVKEIILFRFS